MLIQDWVAIEFSNANFNDSRLTSRLSNVVSCMARRSSGSLYSLSDNKKEVKGAGRFLNNRKVEMHTIFEPHMRATVERAKNAQYALNIQDTTTLNYYRHPSKKDTGHIGSSTKRPDSVGYWVHTGFMCDEKGVPLGISYQEIYSRGETNSGETRDERKTRLRNLPIAEKESQRWQDGAEACQPFRDENVKVVQVCDREADIFEFMSFCQQIGDGFLVRAKSNRLVKDLCDESSKVLFNAIGEKKIQASATLKISGNSERVAKEVNVAIRWCEVELQVPNSNRRAEFSADLEPLKVSVIQVSSQSKINGKPINWVLLTNIPIVSKADAIKFVGWYAIRWRIEVFHKVLKSGLGVEDCRLQAFASIANYLILKSIIAYKIMLMTYFIRDSPKEKASALFEEDELSLLITVLFPGHRKRSMTAKEVILRVAAHGGFFPNGDRHPGVVALWRGWDAVCHKMDAVRPYI